MYRFAGLFNLLIVFLAMSQCVLSRDQLPGLSRLSEGEVYDRAIDVQVGRLRKKLQVGSTSLIRTERGAGYSFTEAGDRALSWRTAHSTNPESAMLC